MDQDPEFIALKAKVGELTTLVQTLQKQVENNGRNIGDSILVVGPYASGSPSADGVIPASVNGIRVNILVDKI